LILEPLNAAVVAPRPVTEIMGRSVNFDRQLRRWAIKIDHILADRMLSPEGDTVRRSSQQPPKEGFRQAHVPAEFASFDDAAAEFPAWHYPSVSRLQRLTPPHLH
jgi:hypothetical protein